MKVIFKNTKLEFQTKPEEVNLTVRTESNTYIGGNNFFGKLLRSQQGGAYNSFVANIEGYTSIGISDREIYAFYTSDPVVGETDSMDLDGNYRIVEVVHDKSYLTPPVGAKYIAISSQESSISITGIL